MPQFFMNRKLFLNEFLGALGADKIIITKENPDSIVGTVIYDASDPDEKQDFIWHFVSQPEPSIVVYRIMTILNKFKLLSIDKIVTSPSELLSIYNKEFPENLSLDDFMVYYDKIFDYLVNMVDDGEETDFYFIHD